jgi:hypothetical protein
MAFTNYTTATNIIGTLGTDPGDRPDLDDQGLKDKFDENAKNIVIFLNDTHLPEAQAGLNAKDNVKITFAAEDTASRTLALTDRYKWIKANHASVAINYTVPPSPGVAWEEGDWIIIEQIGAAQAAIVAGSGVTFKPSTKLKVNGQDTQMVLTYKGSNVWTVSGSTKA